jgi:hypothetical protein
MVWGHWNNSLLLDMSLHSETLSWFWANQSALTPKSGVFGRVNKYQFYSLWLERPVLEPTNYCIRGEHAIHYTTDAFLSYEKDILHSISCFSCIDLKTYYNFLELDGNLNLLSGTESYETDSNQKTISFMWKACTYFINDQ